MSSNLTLKNGKLFEERSENIYFVYHSSIEGSTIVNIDNKSSRIIHQRLPEGQMCHATNFDGKKTQYVYDIFSDSLLCQELQISRSYKINAIRLKECKVIHRRYDGSELFYLKPSKLNLQIYEILPNNKNITFKKFISDNVVKGFIDCWITPVSTKSGKFEWVVVPSSIPPRRLYLYTNLYDKINKMFTKENIGLGVVVGIGKIAVHKYLINCPLEFELGSTRLCVYEKVYLLGYITMVLVKSKPIQLKRKYIETFVTPGGSVLIKTIVGKPFIAKSVIEKPKYQKKTSNIKPKIISPCFNYSEHPFFGTIVFSRKMVWSATTLRVLIGATLNSDCRMISSSSTGNNFFIFYHILAFHDGERYFRVPDVPDEMFDAKNFLINNDTQMWSDKRNPTMSMQLLPPPISHESCIEGRYISDAFIKHSEVNEWNPDENEVDTCVPYSFFQSSRR